MNFIILDLEWNSVYLAGQKRFFNEIIEVGAVKINEDFEVIDTFESFIRPQLSRFLTSYVMDLTKISFEDLQQAPSFHKCMKQFERFIGENETVFFTWSTTDINVLLDNCSRFLKAEGIPFLTNFCNLQRYVQNRLNTPGQNQLGLDTAARSLGLLDAPDNNHRALDDSLLSCQVFKTLYDGDLEGYVQKVDEDFFYRLLYKARPLTDLSDPLINKRKMRASCPSCKRPAKRQGVWTSKNRTFQAVFFCPVCRKKFICRMEFKQKIDEVAVKRKYLPFVSNNKKPFVKKKKEVTV